MASLCLCHQDASIDMHMTNFGHYVILTWGQTLTLTFQGQIFEASLRQKHDDAIADFLS